MKIIKIEKNKKEYLDLLLLGDEQESMIDKYLSRGDMFVLDDDGALAQCVVLRIDDGVYELKNIAVLPDFQMRGYARQLIEFIFTHYRDCKTLYAGTGDNDAILSFYKKCGFKKSHCIENYFVDNYDHPIFEDNKQLVDMIVLKKIR